MITITKNYTNKQTNKKRTDRILGQMVKAKLYRKNHTKKHTYTHSQKEKREKDTGDSTAKHDRGKKNGLGSHSQDFKLEPNQDTFPSLKEKEPGNICP